MKTVKLKVLSGGQAKSGPKLDEQIDKLYKMNKRVLRKYLPETEFRTRKEIFKHHIKQLVEDGYTPNQAIVKMARSRLFMSQGEIAKENLYNKIKEDAELFKRFRILKGWNEKYDSNKLQYIKSDGKKDIYKYYSSKGPLMVVINKSPQDGSGASIEIYPESSEV